MRPARILAAVALAGTIALWSAPAPASALSVGGALCDLTGLVSGLLGRACSVAGHAGGAISAGKQLLGGHVGGAISALTGGGVTRTVARAAALSVIATSVSLGASSLIRDVASVIGSSTAPDLRAGWFRGTYWRVAGVALLLTLPFLFAAAIHALARSDLALLARAAFGWLPLGMIAVGIAAPVTMLLLAASDEMSAIVSSAAGHAGISLLARVALGNGLAGLSGNMFATFFVGLIAATAAIVLWIELLVREAAVYVIVLMLPLFFAAMVWPTRRVWAGRAVELLVALILSKFAIVAVLTLGGSALNHASFPGIGTLLAGTALLLMAGLCPWALMRLLPLHELAGSAAGGLSHAAGRRLMWANDGGHALSSRLEEVAVDLPARLRAQAGDDASPPGAGSASWSAPARRVPDPRGDAPIAPRPEADPGHAGDSHPPAADEEPWAAAGGAQGEGLPVTAGGAQVDGARDTAEASPGELSTVEARAAGSASAARRRGASGTGAGPPHPDPHEVEPSAAAGLSLDATGSVPPEVLDLSGPEPFADQKSRTLVDPALWGAPRPPGLEPSGPVPTDQPSAPVPAEPLDPGPADARQPDLGDEDHVGRNR